MGIWYEKALQVRKDMNKINSSLTDAQIASAPLVVGTMLYDGELIASMTPIKWGEDIMRAAVDLWDSEENNPDNAPTLWKKLPYKDGYRIIPEVITVTEAFKKNECGWWTDGLLYCSKIDNNVYTPAEYAQNWEVVEN